MTLSSKKMFDGRLRYDSYKSFLSRRFARIYPMYFLVLVFGFAIMNSFDGKVNFLWGLTLLSILFAPGQVLFHLWSLSAEWVAYLVYPALLKVATRINSFLYYLLVMGFALILLKVAFDLHHSMMPKDGTFAIPKIPAVLKCFSEYLIGIVIYQLVNFKAFKKFLKAWMAWILIAVIFILLCNEGTDLYLVFAFALLIASIASVSSSVSRFFSSRIVYFLGLISYSVYLIHPIFLFYFKTDFYARWNHEPFAPVVFNVIYVLVIVSLSYLTYRWIELPMQTAIKNQLVPSVAKGYSIVQTNDTTTVV